MTDMASAPTAGAAKAVTGKAASEMAIAKSQLTTVETTTQDTHANAGAPIAPTERSTASDTGDVDAPKPLTDEHEAPRDKLRLVVDTGSPRQQATTALANGGAPTTDAVIVISSVFDGDMESRTEPEAATMTRGVIAEFKWMAPNSSGVWCKASKTITPKAALAHGNKPALSAHQTVMWGNGSTADVNVDWILPLVTSKLKTKAAGAPARKRKRKQTGELARYRVTTITVNIPYHATIRYDHNHIGIYTRDHTVSRYHDIIQKHLKKVKFEAFRTFLGLPRAVGRFWTVWVIISNTNCT